MSKRKQANETADTTVQDALTRLLQYAAANGLKPEAYLLTEHSYTAIEATEFAGVQARGREGERDELLCSNQYGEWRVWWHEENEAAYRQQGGSIFRLEALEE